MTRRSLAALCCASALLVAACGDVADEADAQAAAPGPAVRTEELRRTLSTLEARVSALEQRAEELSAAPGGASLRHRNDELLMLGVRLSALEARTGLVALPAQPDPLFCIADDRQLRLAIVDFYINGVPVCGIR